MKKSKTCPENIGHHNNVNVKPFLIFFGMVIPSLVNSPNVFSSDLQIYAAPSEGQKTLVMMLDTSGSMGIIVDNTANHSIAVDYGIPYLQCSSGYDTNQNPRSSAYKKYQEDTVISGSISYKRQYCAIAKSDTLYNTLRDQCNVQTDGTLRCYTRLSRLKDGMFAFLDSTDPFLPKAYVGLGSYSVNSGRAGRIIVPAKQLGAVGSEQRLALKKGVAALSAGASTPTSHAYAEAAAYLLGTTTYGSNLIKTNGWTTTNNTNDSGVNASLTSASTYPDIFVNSSASTTNLRYKSPLPASNKRVSCDGQGIYFLSDGLPNNTSNDRSADVMSNALGTFGSNFSCSATGGLSNISSDSGWACMGEFAKHLYNNGRIQATSSNARNPQNVSIQTAFVGFGRDFSNLSSSTHVQNACKLSSQTQDERKSNDACSPNNINTTNNSNYAIPKPGFGNGGFFTTQTKQGVTDSVIQFIKNLGDDTIDPIATGAISVPVDALNPNGFQPFGYLRAVEPNPGQTLLTWSGNLKKYGIKNGALYDGSTSIFDTKGEFSLKTKDIWNTTNIADGGLINQGGVYWNLPMPTGAVSATNEVVFDGKIVLRASPAIEAQTDNLRNLYSDIDSVGQYGELNPKNKGILLNIPEHESATTSQYVLDRFNNQAVLKDFPISLKVKILNYLGYDLDLTTTEELPTKLETPKKPFTNLGASIHSFPVQLTYSGEMDKNGDLTKIRKQSVLFGSMEGGLHIVDGSTGVEQMVFVPREILADDTASRALRLGEAGSLTHGVSGAWVADPSYEIKRGNSEGSSTVSAKSMNVYGGLRMGGKSYYGMNVLDPKNPKLLFRVGQDQSDYSRMGQSWSKPVMANIRHEGKVKRVMIVGGGYDICYENPRFKFGTTNPAEFGGGCNKTAAEGNAVYIIDAQTGKRLWWTSNSSSDTNNSDLKHSIVSKISTLDRDADGLVDHLYFGDLGGQVFRADLNNKATGSTDFGVRVVRLGNLATQENGNPITNGDAPRFYQPPTVSIHDEGPYTFILVSIASGDRSTPLDVSPIKGRDGMVPYVELSGRPTNKIYGLIDRDFMTKNLITGTPPLLSQNIAMNQLQKNPQTLSATGLRSVFFPYSNTIKHGWYRSLSSDYTGNEVSNRTSGGVKAFEEEPVLIANTLILPVYDPEGTGVEPGDPCKPRVVGESDRQQYCLPFGMCLSVNGLTKDIDAEKRTGMVLVDGKNQNVIGSGIRGIALGPTDDNSNSGKNSCGGLTVVGNVKGSGEWSCTRVINPTRWYEKYVKAN